MSEHEQFEGSIWQQLEYDRETCRHCGAHLHGGVCLNACSLTVAEYRKMQAGLAEAAHRIAGAAQPRVERDELRGH